MFSSQLAELYGDVYSVRLGGDQMVFVCGYKMVKEAIVTQADNFVDRPYSALSDRFYAGDKGVQLPLPLPHAVRKCVLLNLVFFTFLGL